MNNTVPAATKTVAGIMKLSSATNSDDETLAATPKAVKIAYDLAKTVSIDAVNKKFDKASVLQTTGNATDKVISQKACTDIFAKKNSQEGFTTGGIIIKYGNPTLKFQTTRDNSNSIFELNSDKKTFKLDYRNPDNTLKNSVIFPNKNGTLALTSDVDAINNYPVGAPIPWPQANPPKGYLVCNGDPFDKVKCPKLLIAYPSGKLPDLRGEFIRGLSAGRENVDVGRTVLSAQGDAIRNITGTFKGSAGRFNPEYVTGVFKLESMNALGAGHSNNNELGKVSFDLSRVVPTANENRPRNVTFLYIVRAA